MKTESRPLVTVITPVYNAERYLEECIRSVLAQTYTNVQYLIVNNCSTDATLDIAKRYKEIDSRIQVYDYPEFVDVIESHNRAFRLVSAPSKYCKVLSGDDSLFPECIEKLVDVAEANPSVGVVGSYVLTGGPGQYRVRFDGLPYWSTVVRGREAARWHLLGGRYFLGIPTSVLFRSDLVRRTLHFFPNSREHADISAFYECLLNSDFGFSHQVLSFERVHEAALGAKAKKLSSSVASHLLDLRQYGPLYLSEAELECRFSDALRIYYDVLATGAINLRGREFWAYHKAVTDECGCRLFGLRLGKALLEKTADLLFNPKRTVQRIQRRRTAGSRSSRISRDGAHDWLSEAGGDGWTTS